MAGEPLQLAVILAGGKGTRLKPFTMAFPKPLLPVGDTPIIEVVIQQLAKAGIQRIVLVLGHMAPLFSAILGDGSKWGVKIEPVFEDTPLGTAGGLRLIRGIPQDFLVMNGDILTTLDYQALVDEHRRKDAWATIAMTHREVSIDYGVVVASPDGLLEQYEEKPKLHYDVSMGINVISKRGVELIPSSGKFDMPELMQAIHKAGKPVLCHKTDCYWQDIGLFDDYRRASEDFTASPGRFIPR